MAASKPTSPPAPRARPSAAVPESLAGAPLDRVVRELAGALLGEGAMSWNRARRLLETGKVRLDGEVVADRGRVARPGQTLEIFMNAPAPRSERLSERALIYVDAQLAVVEKPAGINSEPFDENDRGALSQLVEQKLAGKSGRRGSVGVVHRLDRETTGLLVFARTLEAKRELKQQFREHTVKRRYWALAEGAVESRTITSRLVADRGDGRRGSTSNPTLGQVATTHVRVLERGRGATLLECRLETGRTHQIRIHLAEAGHPLLGERVYGPWPRHTALPAPRVMLHAFELGFVHPVTERPLLFGSPMPDDLRRVLHEVGISRIPEPGVGPSGGHEPPWRPRL